MKGRGAGRRQKKPPVRQKRTKQEDTVADDTLSGVPRKKTLRRVDRKNPGVLTVRGEYSERGVWVVLMGGDFEVYVDGAGIPQLFRRRNTVRKVSGVKEGSIDTLGMQFTKSKHIWGAKNLDRAEFNHVLVGHLALAVRRCTLDEGAIAKAEDLVQIIIDAAEKLQKIAGSTTQDADRLRKRADGLAGQVLTQLIRADLRKVDD